MSSAPLFSLGPIDQLADDEVAGIAISGGVKRDGDEWVPSGIDLTNYRANPIVLRNHDPDLVVGTAVAIGLVNANEIGVRIKFAPPGVSDVADETRGLVKAGVLRGISAGINPIELEPLDPKQPYGAVRLVKAELLEVSFVPIPADSDARVTARSFAASLRSLPAISGHAIERALAHVGRTRAPQRPIGLLSDYERTRIYAEAQRQRTMAVWALGQANQAEQRERDERYSFAQRQADLAHLRSGAEDSGERQFARRRLRPYAG
jgi:HK97 family phage prohead protease